jgi:hypothetical protein
MKNIPETRGTLVLRTDFSDEAGWEAICTAVEEPVGEFQAQVDFISDPAYKDLTVVELVELIPPSYNHLIIFVVDHVSISSPENPIIVMDLSQKRDRTFRVIPLEMWGVENNLSIGNMSYYEFAASVDSDGIFRGFR